MYIFTPLHPFTADAARAADSARVQELEASLTQMTVALDEAKGRITQLQAENAAAEASAVSAAPTSSSLPQPPAIALRGDSVLSLEAQAKTAGADFFQSSVVYLPVVAFIAAYRWTVSPNLAIIVCFPNSALPMSVHIHESRADDSYHTALSGSLIAMMLL